MKISASVLFLALTLALHAAAEEDWTRLDPEALPDEWADFQRQLAERRWVEAELVEERYFPFRFRPVELTGTVWYGREEGLTLNYREPREEVIRIDENGVRVIESDGRRRSRQIPEQGREVPVALLSMFRLDFAELEKVFAIHGRLDGDSWALRFTPHDKDAAPVERMELAGEQDEIHRIVIERTSRRRIELTLSNAEFPSDLGDEEHERAFP